MGVKNRPYKMVKATIDALRNQRESCKAIIVSYGSSKRNYIWEKKIIPSENIKLIRVTRGTRNFDRARALNIGLKVVETEYIMWSDIDTILAENFIEQAIKVLKENKGKRVVLLCRRLEMENAKYPFVGKKSQLGNCTIVTRKWAMKVHGMDEKFVDLGVSDGDFVNRAVQDGHKEVWLHDKTEIWHQYHEPSDKKFMNKNIKYNAVPKSVIRNSGKWGEI